jgi:hypothetical protein
MGWSLRGEICLRAGHGFPAVRFIDNVIAHKHGIGFMANDVHNHPFWDPGASHVPRRGPPEVMKEPPGDAGFATGRPPGFPEVTNRQPMPVEDPRDHASGTPLALN